MSGFDEIARLVPHEGPGRHSGVHAGGLSRSRFLLIRDLGNEVVFDPLHGEELGIIEVPDHAVVGEVLEQQGHPPVGIGADAKGDVLTVNACPDLDPE